MDRRSIIAAIGAVLMVTCLSAQEKQFKAAIKEGRKADSFYVIENPNYRYSVSDFQSLAAKYDCIFEYTTKEVQRFGSVSQVVDRAYLLPRSEFYDFICANLSQPWGSAGLATKTKGNAGWMYYYPDKNARKQSYFFRYDNVYWSGPNDGGLISGTGEGFAYNDTWMVAFSGKFHKGYPSGRVKFRWLSKKQTGDSFKADKVIEMTSFSGGFHDDMAWFKIEDKYGFIDAASQQLMEPKYGTIVSDFRDAPFAGTNYAVIKHTDGYEWKMNRSGELFAYSDAQEKIFADQKAAQLEAERQAAEQRRLAAEKRKADRAVAEKQAEQKRIKAEEDRRAYIASVKANMDKSRWMLGDRLCLEYYNPGTYITGTLESWNEDKSRCQIKVVTSPGSRMKYNGENLEKNTTMWVAASGEGWHKAMPEEIEAANRQDNSTYQAKTDILLPKKCPDCNGTGWITRRVTHRGWLGSYTDTETSKCSRCDASGWIEQTQTLTF